MQWTPEEQAEHRKLWVEALRSGGYLQGRLRLRDDVGHFCCLGVACEISGLGDWRYLQYRVLGHDRGAEVSLPIEVQSWLGLSSQEGEYFDGPFLTMLTTRNDSGATFSEIADIIESEPEGLVDKVEAA